MIDFEKYHGLGNDFIIIDNMKSKISLSTEKIKTLCDRHKGVGADGLILVEPSEKSDCFMNYYNADGTPAEMCGNGVRCTAKFLKDNLGIEKKEYDIETRAGVKKIIKDGGETFSVNMGRPVFTHQDFPDEPLEFEGLNLNFASMGNPHAIAFVNNLDNYDLAKIGPKIENAEIFPNRVNLELVKEIKKDEFRVKVWERGSGITLACGTGACAVYAVAQKQKKVDGVLTIHLPGGKLLISSNQDGEIIMQGEAKHVFRGQIE